MYYSLVVDACRCPQGFLQPPCSDQRRRAPQLEHLTDLIRDINVAVEAAAAAAKQIASLASGATAATACMLRASPGRNIHVEAVAAA